jgi:hypothetical protein
LAHGTSFPPNPCGQFGRETKNVHQLSNLLPRVLLSHTWYTKINPPFIDAKTLKNRFKKNTHTI